MSPANRKKPGTWDKGKSGNPKGRPAEGQSWAAIWREITNKTPEQLAVMVGGNKTDMGRNLALLPKGVAIKYLVALRVIIQTMFEPNASLINAMMEREEGKVPDKLEGSGELKVTIEYANQGNAPGSTSGSSADQE